MSVPKSAIEDELDPEVVEQIERNKDLRALLASWANPTEEERAEQIETWEYLKKALERVMDLRAVVDFGDEPRIPQALSERRDG